MRFVTGFLFGRRQEVVLIEKNRPEFQKGRLNGVGGKVEEGESSVQAMEREFREETGVTVPADSWTHFAEIEGIHGGVIDLFYARDPEAFEKCESVTDEKIFRCRNIFTVWPLNLMPNIKWLVQLALTVEDEESYSDGTQVMYYRLVESMAARNVVG